MDFLCFTLGVTSGARAVTSAGQAIAMPGGDGDQLRVVNIGPNPVAVRAQVGSTAAAFPTDAATCNGQGVVLPSGGVETFTIPQGADTINAICAAAQTATIFVSRGKGI